MLQYDSRKKNKTTAYILGGISMFIPLALHKFYLGDFQWAAVYILLVVLSLMTVGTVLGGIFSILYSILMLCDVVKTSIDVDSHNNKLIEELGVNCE